MSEHDTSIWREEVKGYIRELQVTQGEMRKLLTAHSDTIWGQGDDKPGLQRRMDSMKSTCEDLGKQIKDVKDVMAEQKADSKLWRMALATPILGLVIKFFWDILTKQTH